MSSLCIEQGSKCRHYLIIDVQYNRVECWHRAVVVPAAIVPQSASLQKTTTSNFSRFLHVYSPQLLDKVIEYNFSTLIENKDWQMQQSFCIGNKNIFRKSNRMFLAFLLKKYWYSLFSSSFFYRPVLDSLSDT